MKRILRILVAVVTCFSVLTATYLPVFAAFDFTGVNHQGYKYYLDEDGVQTYDYPIALDPEVLTYDQLGEIGLFVTGVEEEVVVEYVVTIILPWLAGSGASGGAAAGGTIASGGAAATGGAAAVGSTATIMGFTTGEVVLFAALAATGVVCLTEPDLVQATVCDIFRLLDPSTQAALNEIELQETWLLNEQIIEDINAALTKMVFIYNGVLWNDSLIVSENDLTGLTTTFPESNPVVENQPANGLSIEYYQLKADTWTTIDTSGTILYRVTSEPSWTVQGNHSGPDRLTLSVYNTATGSCVKFYPCDDGRYPTTFQLSTEDYRKWWVGEPIFVNDGEKTAVQFVFGRTKNTSNYYTFWGQMSSGPGVKSQYPIILTGTGSVLDDKLVTGVEFNSDSGLWNYTYKNLGESDSDSKTVELPMEPFKWVMTPSQPETKDSNASALNSVINNTYLDDYGKIEKESKTEVPQIDILEVQFPRIEYTVDGDDDDNKKNYYIPPDLPSSLVPTPDIGTDDPGAGDGTDDPGNPGDPDDPDFSLDKVDPDDDSPDTFTGWISAVFSLNGLFDWLPEEYSSQFDNVIALIGTLVVTMFIYSIIKIFF